MLLSPILSPWIHKLQWKIFHFDTQQQTNVKRNENLQKQWLFFHQLNFHIFSVNSMFEWNWNIFHRKLSGAYMYFSIVSSYLYHFIHHNAEMYVTFDMHFFAIVFHWIQWNMNNTKYSLCSKHRIVIHFTQNFIVSDIWKYIETKYNSIEKLYMVFDMHHLIGDSQPYVPF